MLSILIPTYNYDVTTLITQLHIQLVKSNVTYEIICFDDGSISKNHEHNNSLNKLKNVIYKRQVKNVGLSENRNCLAKASSFKYLIFIDGDSLLPNKNFINNYVNHIQNDTEVIYGGRVHPEKVSPDRRLRHKYGKLREDMLAIKRKKNTYKCLLFNNTLIQKELFNKITFDKVIVQYGHEDTLFAYNVQKLKANVQHIENPVIHGDVDLNEVFLKKMYHSIENLNLIYSKKIIDPNFITFLKIFIRLKRFGINYVLALMYLLFHPFMKYISISKSPSLLIFDSFRLSYFCYINLKKKDA